MACSDPFLGYLKSFGYCVVRLPRASIRPLQVLARRGDDLEVLGDLTTLLVAGENVALPVPSENVPAAGVSGQRTSDLGAGVGLSLLGSVIGAMGGSKLGLDAKYRDARTVAFEFSDVLRDEVEVLKLDQYLADADVSPFSKGAAALLDADDLYVVTATIKSSRLTVDARRSDGSSVSLNVPELQQLVGGDVSLAASSTSATRITYAGKVPLVFGFQAVQLHYDGGRYTRFEPLRAGSAGLKQVAPAQTVRLTTPGAFARVTGL